jgi:hypothetical protein
MWLFATHDHAGADRPAGQVDEVGELGDLSVVAERPVWTCRRRLPVVGSMQ